MQRDDIQPENLHGNVFLIGPMGVGKTTVGRALARALGRPFHDSDKEIEAQTGVDIPTIFEFEGEAGFRDREATMIERLSARHDIVLATGGGAVLRAENRRHLAARGMVVFLNASLNELLRRTRRDRNRPLLQTADPRARLEQILRERTPIYRELADLELTTDGRRGKQIVPRICRLLAERDPL